MEHFISCVGCVASIVVHCDAGALVEKADLSDTPIISINQEKGGFEHVSDALWRVVMPVVIQKVTFTAIGGDNHA